MKDIGEIKEMLQNTLTPRRYKHSLGVADTASQLAMRFGFDPQRAYTAGLVHDCAKDMSLEQMLNWADSYDVVLDELTLKSPALVHGPVGAQIIRHHFEITDEDIISSVHFHTTGKAHMGLLEKIIYLSDFIEPSRNYEGVEQLRETARRDLDVAVFQALSNTIGYVISLRAPLHINTEEARNFILLHNIVGEDVK